MISAVASALTCVTRTFHPGILSVPLAGTSYIPGVSEERTLSEIKRLLERHIENPIDYLTPEVEPTAAGE